MWTVDGDSSREEEYPKSDIACQSCRKRKIKCGRELPHCSVCEQASQICEYPARILKPGPKIGSTHQNRKRRRREESNNAENPSPKDTQDGSGMGTSSDTISVSREEDGRDTQDRSTAAKRRQSSSSKHFEDQTRTCHDSINIHDLSFILHPAHEPSMSEKNTSPNSMTDGLEHGKSTMLAQASHCLDVAPDVLEKMVKIYFDNMTAINLFHEPTFEEKILSIGSNTQCYALLASILAFSARFCNSEDQDGHDFHFNGLSGMNHRPAYFLDLASRLVEESLRDCDDEAPQLCILQAQILLAHGQLTQGVRGKAWRSLGTCVRLAYELNLHLVDAGNHRDVADAKQWSENEEKRRAWWAVWEMDVFASTVRRYPTAVNWSQIETLLPSEDEYWFKNQPRKSCFLEQDLVLRWKALQESGNQSAKAWFIVINSLMKEAQSISSPRSIPNLDIPDDRRQSVKSAKEQQHANTIAEEAREKLETLSNCVRCFVMALPTSLKYRNQYLSFDNRQPGETSSSRQNHCGLYNIHVMTQLARLMIHHFDIFAESRGSRAPQDKSSRPSAAGNMKQGENMSMRQYFEAADEILRIVSRSSDDHIQHINAFLASTIWLASAVQLVRRKFGPAGTNQSLVKSKFEVLNMTYKKCVSFWGIQNAMQQNLETLDAQLETFRVPIDRKPERGQANADRRPHVRKDSWVNNSMPNSAARYNNPRGQSVNGTPLQQEQQTSSTPNNPNNVTSQPADPLPNHLAANNLLALHSSLPDQGQDYQMRRSEQGGQLGFDKSVFVEPLSPALSSLDFMHMPSQMDKHQHQPTGTSMDGSSPSFMQDASLFQEFGGNQNTLNSDGMQGEPFGMYENGWNTELPSYIHDLLSGACKY